MAKNILVSALALMLGCAVIHAEDVKPAAEVKPVEVKKDELAVSSKPAEVKKDDSAASNKPAEVKKDEHADHKVGEAKKDGDHKGHKHTLPVGANEATAALRNKK